MPGYFYSICFWDPSGICFYFLLSNILLYGHTTICVTIHRLTSPGLFPFGVIINKATKHLYARLCINIHFITLKWITGFYGNSVFNFKRNLLNVFRKGHTIVHSCQQYMQVLLVPLAQQVLFLFSGVFIFQPFWWVCNGISLWLDLHFLMINYVG